MANHSISSDLKQCTLRLWNDGWDIVAICEMLGISQASMYRWEAIFAEYGDVNCPPSPIQGQSLRILTRALMTACEELFAEESDLYLDEVITWLGLTHDIIVSKATLCRNLKEVGLTRKILHKMAAERNEVLREDKNELTWARHYGRAMAGQRAELSDVFSHGDRYSLAAALTIDGYMAADVVEGSFDSETFYEFIATKVLPYMNPFPAEQSVLVLDNCRIHHYANLVDLVRNAGKSHSSCVTS
ncbi:hypothetical protein PAXRUDRAFT_791254 [Paxillus rubicundulus Ve08.2h10]|uniref:Tc1-like transposase DDE domain-containing protein n=1 Tax=Paxillus rubicundulus Ve08.2h10 TaxID=930991 RepID=A0A0D0CTD6_9AGAM|nr:hypothetical protein PAXRUDRAFT_791254 [Paxillus rubicundulus Ve08.2h10]